MSILICGGTGFLGSHIVRSLASRHLHLRVLTRKARTSTVADVEYIQGNVFDPASLEKAMQGCDTVINAVQFDNAPFENPSKGLTYEKVDAEGTEAIVRAAKASGVKRMIYISGAGTSAEKTEAWFRAKWRAEQAVKSSGAQWTIFRPSWIYGPDDHSLNRMITMIRWSPLVSILGKGYRIQPVFVDDVANLVAKSVDAPHTFGQIYQVGGPEALTMNEMLQCTARILRKKRMYLNIPKPVAGLLFSILEKIPGFPVTRASLDFVTMDIVIPKSEQEKVEKDFQIKLVTLQEGLQTYL